jgi:hypothetical protein
VYVERGQDGFGGYSQILEEMDNDGCFAYPLSHQKQIHLYPLYPLNPRYPRSLTKDY